MTVLAIRDGNHDSLTPFVFERGHEGSYAWAFSDFKNF